MEYLINWVELSRHLAGNESSVSRNRCPKKYQKRVDSLIEHLKAWEKKIEIMKTELNKNEKLSTENETRSCIGCQFCIVMANKQLKNSYACMQRVWTEILPNIDDLIGRTCDRYVAE